MMWPDRTLLNRREDVVMVAEPWARVRTPAPIPEPLDAAALLEMTDDGFGELIRSNLMPREDQPGGRARWTRLWAVLAGDDGLTERTFDALEELLDATEDALDRGGLDPAQSARAEKFVSRCKEAWSRLQRTPEDAPLGWAGPAASGFNPPARRVIDTLVTAIARHRTALEQEPIRDADQRLWAVLERVQLDPRSFGLRDGARPRR